MRRLEAATSMVLLLMSILTVQKGVLGTMITNLAANVKKTKLLVYYIIYFQVFLKVLLSPVLICTGHIHHIFEVATNSLPMVPSKHLFVFCQNSALTQLTFSNFHLYTILLYHIVQRGYYYKTFNERGSRN